MGVIVDAERKKLFAKPRFVLGSPTTYEPMAQQPKEKGKDVKNILIAGAALCLLAGCATRPADVTSYVDETGLRTDLLADNLLEAPGKPREVVYLNASRVFTSADKSKYYLEATYVAPMEVGYLDISFGQTLTLLLDGQPMPLTGSGSLNMRKVTKEKLVRETALYEVTKAQLQKIAAARKVQVKIRGANGLVEREFRPKNYEKFRLFVITYAG